jgi:hypothetical protein
VAIGNLAAYRVQQERHEPLAWQVLRVEEQGRHHFRLVLRHPDRVLDLGFERSVTQQLDDLSNESVDELRVKFEAAQRSGLKPVPLRHVRESVDLWQDDFWNWFG